MSNIQFHCDYYVVMEDGIVKETHLPNHVCFENNCLKATNKEPVQLQMVYQLTSHAHMEVSYEIEARCQIDIIETKIFEDGAQFEKAVKIGNDAIVHIFSENDCQNKETITCHEDVYLQSQAHCQCGYAELSDGSYDGSYHYYLDGEGAEVTLRMAALSQNKDHKHYEVLICHNQPHTYGQMDNYGVVKDGGQLIIDGVGTITKGQTGSASHQTNKIMVFDENCIASANPFLYIDEYDVQASHAAGVG